MCSSTIPSSLYEEKRKLRDLGLGYETIHALEGAENEHINILEVIVSHQVDDHIEDGTLCRIYVDPTIVERLVIFHVTDDFIDDVDEHLSHEQSWTNKTARQKQPYNHSSGSKSFLQRQHELAEKKGEPVDHVELFQETHVRAGTIKCWNSNPNLPQRVVSHSLGMRYAIRCWVDDQATQQALVGDPSRRPARQ
ncbi:CACTA en-spm transposon protein [Cucumis melo var. makuwa]|uniref:CACTA en-spm transposon protein n=1 Tax=Cucumis melo var. makuwa TaxID=1194695 RepID=A0A5D3C375_CUCMM|nr:CACTA en-spm transposon protein [Cucumis melo var. makuwa]